MRFGMEMGKADFPEIQLLSSPAWQDYQLLDSGDGEKLERFGPYTFVRPEVQALWSRSLPREKWESAHAVFQPTREESGGHWVFRRKLPPGWEMKYGPLRFTARTTPGRHLGVFPECAANWDWMTGRICSYHGEAGGVENDSPATPPEGGADRQVRVLNLFGYTGIASLAAASAGAKVTHVDASKKSVSWARENQSLSGLSDRPVRWIIDDALKFVEREARRGAEYEGILLDPPKFGRGPKGEVWEAYHSLPALLSACRKILGKSPLFVILTVYAVKLPAVNCYYALEEMVRGLGGELECGELVTRDASAGHVISQAVFARWKKK